MIEIFLHELRNSIFNGKLAVAFVLMLAAFLVSLGMMSQEYNNRLANYEDSFSLPGDQLFWNKFFYWEFEDGRSTSSDILTFPMGMVKRPEPLLFFSRGLDKQMRQSVEFVSTFPIVNITVKPDQEVNQLKLIFAAPDLLFIMKVLVSLLAILFAYNLVCVEREHGTLKVLLVSGASRASIFGGKYLGGLFSIWTAFSAAFLVYLLALVFLTPVNLQGEMPIRIGMIFLTSLLHIAVFFGIGAAVSAFFRNSAPALIISLFFWLLLVFALPGLSSLLAQQFAPVDSPQKVARMKLEKAQQMESEYTEQHPEDTNISNTAGYGRRHDTIRDQINEELAAIDSEYLLRKEAQAQITTNLARISPVGSLTYLYSALSRNGLEDVERYQDDLIEIREMVNDRITGMLNEPEFGREYTAGGFDIPEEERRRAFGIMDAALEMGFTQLSIEESMESAWLDFLLMSLFAIASAAIAFTRFLFYDPR